MYQIPSEEGERQPSGVSRGCDIREEMAYQNQAVEDGEIQWPDSQDAADIERPDVNLAGLLPFTQEQFHDQEGTQKKKDRDAKGTGREHREQRAMPLRVDRDVVHPVEGERAKECEETQRVQLGAIEARRGRSGGP